MNDKYLFKKTSIFIIVILLNGCIYDPPLELIIINNTSAGAIAVSTNFVDSIPSHPQLKLVDYWNKNGKMEEYSPEYIIPANSDSNGVFRPFTGDREPNDTLFIFVLQDTLISNHSWDEISQKQLFTKKYTYTIAQLEQMKWEITYP